MVTTTWLKLAWPGQEEVDWDPEQVGYNAEWGEHHGPVRHKPDTWNYGSRGYGSPPMPMPKKLYHATPFPNKILAEGFRRGKDIGSETFGGHGTYVSLTSLPEAKKYLAVIRELIRVANGDFDGIPWKEVYGYWVQKWNGDPKRVLALVDMVEHWQREGTPNPRKPLLDFFHHAHSFGVDMPFIVANETVLDRLKGLSPDDAGIVEVETLPSTKWHTGVNIGSDSDMTGRYTYNEHETEWRVWNPQELRPVQRVASTEMRWKYAYSTEEAYLRDYLRTNKDRVDPYDYGDLVPEYLNSIGEEILPELRDAEDWEIGDKYISLWTEEQTDAFVDWLERNKNLYERYGSPYHAPAYTYMRYQKFVRPTWLIHFTDNPRSIAEGGFEYGHEDYEGLHLTTLKRNRQQRPGYNFAFVAGSRDSRSAARDHKYGKHAVIFWSSGVESHHSGDEEYQVVFWGPSVNRDMIFPIYYVDGDWMVEDVNGRVVYRGDFDKIVPWVQNNYRMLQNIRRKTGF